MIKKLKQIIKIRSKYSPKQGVFVINVAPLNIHIKTVHNNNINLPYVFIVEKKVILQENALKMRKDYTEKEDHALDVDQSATH